MNSEILSQLCELAGTFNKQGLKPVICGGLGIYIYFKNKDKNRQILRATNDIDLMLLNSQTKTQTDRDKIYNAITQKLNYVVSDNAKYFQFEKPPYSFLDILAPPTNTVETKDFRVKFVKSGLHGYLTEEACFIGEDLKTINLSKVLAEVEDNNAEIHLPSPTNLLILKLFAFDDRNRQNDNE